MEPDERTRDADEADERRQRYRDLPPPIEPEDMTTSEPGSSSPDDPAYDHDREFITRYGGVA